MTDNIDTEETTTVETATSNVVKGVDGVDRNFGKNGQIITEIVITAEAIIEKLFLVTGAVKEIVFPKTNPLYDAMAARGIKEFIGNSIAGVYKDKEGLHPEDFELGIDQAIQQLLSGVIPVRTRASGETKGLSDLIRAYVELRAADERFSEEDSSEAVVKALILGSTPEQNAQRAKQAAVRAKIETYRAERQAARAAKANAAVTPEFDLI